MRTFPPLRLMFAVMLILVVGSAAAQTDSEQRAGSVTEAQFITSTLPSALDEITLNFYPTTQFVGARFAVDEYRVRFLTEYPDGRLTELVAQVYVPNSPDPLKSPVFVYGAGTTGLIDACAPSREQPEVSDWGRYRDYLRTYAAQGLIVIMPDYVGFDDDPDTLQPYYVAEMQGRVALDAARAIYNLYGGAPLDGSGQITPDEAVFIGGYSQGGTTAFGARDIAQTYAPDVPMRGYLAYGSVTDQFNHMLTRPEFSAFRWVSWEDYYGADVVDLSAIFADLYLPTVRNEATTLCVREAFEFYSSDPSQVYRAPFYNALVGGTLAQEFPQHYALLTENSPGISAGDGAPVLVLQGDQDATISPVKMAEFLTDYCAIEGNTVTYNEYLNTTHFDTRQKAYLDTLNWMIAIVSGQPIENHCDQFGQ